MKTWQDKAMIVIGALSKESYDAAQKLRSGKKARHHRPYSIPETAEKLIKAIGANDEKTAKAIFLYDYDAQRILGRKR